MQVIEKNSLFAQVSVEDSAVISGGQTLPFIGLLTLFGVALIGAGLQADLFPID